MTWSRVLSLVIVGVCFCAGCKKAGLSAPAQTPAPNPPPGTLYMTNAQPKLPTIKLWLGAQELNTEVARNPIQIFTGMMFREKMAENEAMLFVFPGPDYRSFYMRNTRVPLSCAYIDPHGTILEIYDMKPLDETPIPSISDQIQYVLEVPQGWFKRNKVEAGASVRTEAGTLPDTFFPGRRRNTTP